MMKRIISAVTALFLLIIILVGCQSGSDSPAPSSSSAAPLPSATTAKEPEPLKSFISRAGLSEVRMEASDWAEKIRVNAEYLKSLDVSRFLYYYYVTAHIKVPDGVRSYGGWEIASSAWSGGMAMGHVLSALSMMYASTGEAAWRDKVNFMVGELEKCQLDNGYLFGGDESFFDRLEKNQGNCGVPYYNMHKTFAGLIDAYRFCGNDKALAIAERLSAWVNGRMSALTDAVRQRVLLTEYGGMNEALYNLYAITGNERDKKTAEFFNEALYLDNWADNVDNLAYKHANTAIPKAVGYARGYMATGEAKLLSAAQNFWEMTAGKRLFATGGMTEAEIFGQAGHTSGQIYDIPSETCVSYNMIKLSQYLYEITGAAKYLDYIERTLLNSIMGSINQEGGKTYYQWLDTDVRKLFSTLYSTFWCCVSTGMENFSKVGEACYHAENKNTLQVNIFIPSSYHSDQLSLTLTGSDGVNSIKINAASTEAFTLKLRVPYWASAVSLKINGETIKADAVNGYIALKRAWAKGDTIEYTTVYKAYTEPMPDNKDLFAIKYGPYVLAATGKRYELSNKLAGSFTAGYLADLTKSIKPTADGYELTTPFFKAPLKKYGLIVDETYTVYFKRVDTFTDKELLPDIAMRAALTSSTNSKSASKNILTAVTFYDTKTAGVSTYLDCIQDGKIPASSAGEALDEKTMRDDIVLYEAVYRMAQGEKWLCYTFDKPYEITGVSVFWCNNTTNKIYFPESFKVQYYDGAQWHDVANPSGYTIGEGLNTVTFDPVKTNQLRLLVNASKRWGIFEWSVSYNPS